MTEISEEENITTANKAKLHGEMCQKLARLVHWITGIFPALEAIQPKESGMQALCSLHWALDKAKALLQYCANSSKLYLAITGDAVVVKFEKVKDGLEQSLRRLAESIPSDLEHQIARVLIELDETCFVRNSLDQEVGNDLISLLQKEKEAKDISTASELNVFDQAALKLGIASGKDFLVEEKALKKLLKKARSEEDKKKELLVAYVLRLLRRYVKVQKFENIEYAVGASGINSYPSSPSERGSEASTSGRNSSHDSSEICFIGSHEKWTANSGKGIANYSGHTLLPPEEFRCPISLQLMAEPVIISSGQTYERVCIEKWFEEGHNTCPKTQQKLDHLVVTPNYCVKGLIASWCEMHGIMVPEPPPPPPSPITDWRWDLLLGSGLMNGGSDQSKGDATVEKAFVCLSDGSSRELTNLSSAGEICKIDSLSSRMDEASDLKNRPPELHARLDDELMARFEKLFSDLKLSSLRVQCRAAEEIWLLTKVDAEARAYLGVNGFIPALVGFLQTAINAEDVEAQQIAAAVLSNVAIDNNRNKAEIVALGVVPLLLKLFNTKFPLSTREAAIVVLLTVSYLDENKLLIGSSGTVLHLVDHLDSGSNQSVRDALTTLFNLNIFTGNRLCMINAGIVPKLVYLLSLNDAELSGKCTAMLYSLAFLEEGRSAIVETENCISVLAEILDLGTLKEREHACSMFLLLCTNSFQHSCLVLREGVIPSLVMLSVNGSPKGKEKAQKLLQHFRQQRQKDCAWYMNQAPCHTGMSGSGGHALGQSNKSVWSRSLMRKGRNKTSFSFFRRSISFAFYNC